MRRTAALVIALAAASVLAGCTSTGSPAPTTTVATKTPVAKPTAVGAPTCDGIIPSSTVKAFAKVGWTSQTVPFYIGETEITGGIECQWADYSTANDNMQVFGWAPISAEQATTARDQLVADGWHVLKDTKNGTYVTEDKSTIVAPDSEGYGTTFLFGDGWVKVADTKQGLLLVDWPQS